MREIMDKEGTPIEARGNRPVLLDDPGCVWIVKQGSVDIFSVRIRDGAPRGARNHLFSAGVESALFGMETGREGSGTGFIAVGAMGTILLKLSRTRLQELALDGSSATEVKDLLDGWIGNLLSALQSRLPPKDIRRVEAGGELSLDKGAACCAKDGIVWVRHLEGSSFLLGNRDLPPVTKDLLFPVSESAWIQSADKCSLSLCDTAYCMKVDPSWSFLDTFNGRSESTRLNSSHT